MSLPDLPEDPADWPENYYELLGVHPGVSAKDLRRAYARRIRTYKPEQYPEQFRRIREAYEAVLREIEWFRFLHRQDEPSPEPPPLTSDDADGELPVAELTPDDEAGSPSDFTPVSEPPPNPAEEQGAIWEQACSGEEAAAYARLVELHTRNPGRGDVYAPLYWLLKLTPELDPSRSPRDWLARGLRAGGLAGPLRELYRREIEADPTEALSARFNRVLTSPAPAALAGLLEWRWQAAARLQDWKRIRADLEVTRPHLAAVDEDVWVRLVLSALDELLWADPAQSYIAVQVYGKELECYAHLHHRHATAFDRLDFLRELVADWRRLRRKRVPPAGFWPFLRFVLTVDLSEPGAYCFVSLDFLEIVRLSWNRPLEEIRARALAVLGQIAEDPHRWLNVFDMIQGRAPAVLAQFGALLTSLGEDFTDKDMAARSDPGWEETARTFLDRKIRADYDRLRGRLLDFCVREALLPEQVAAAAAGRVEYQLDRDRHLSEALLADWPLRYVCLAHQLFWA